MNAIKCKCGVALDVSKAKAGDHLRCANCGHLHQIPARRPVAPIRPGPRPDLARARGSFDEDDALAESSDGQWIRVMCRCGKPMKAPVAWAGRRAQCPRCKHKMVLPTGAEREKRHDPMDVFYDPNANEDDIADLSRSRSGQLSTETEMVEPGSNLADAFVEDLSKEPDIGLIDAKEATGIMESLSEEIEPMPPMAPMPHAPPPPRGPDEDLEKFLRATCSCGKMVRAPLVGAGKIGLCPKCFQEIAMPLLPGKVRRVFDSASVQQTVNERSATVLGMDAITEDSVPLDADHRTASQMPEIAAAIKNLDPTPDIRQGEAVPADHVLTDQKLNSYEIKFRRKSLYQRFQEGEKLRFRHIVLDSALNPFRACLMLLATSKLIVAVVALILLGGAGLVVYRNMPRNAAVASPETSHPRDFYYDMATGKIVNMSETEYADAVSQGVKAHPTQDFPMVRAYVYACGNCDSSPRQVTFLQRYTPEALHMQEDLKGLIKGGNGNTDRATELTKAIGDGTLVAKIHLDPLVVPGDSTGVGTPVITASEANKTTIQTTQPSEDIEAIKDLIQRLAWVKIEEAKASLMAKPLPDCSKTATLCLPEAN